MARLPIARTITCRDIFLAFYTVYVNVTFVMTFVTFETCSDFFFQISHGACINGILHDIPIHGGKADSRSM